MTRSGLALCESQNNRSEGQLSFKYQQGKYDAGEKIFLNNGMDTISIYSYSYLNIPSRMSSHAELFGRIIHHLTPSGQKPAKAQVYCPREELVDITETDPQKGSTHTVLWWNPEERPQEGTFVRVSGEWKSFRDDVELHVQETECTNQGMFEDVFAYSSSLKPSSKDKVSSLIAVLCVVFSHLSHCSFGYPR